MKNLTSAVNALADKIKSTSDPQALYDHFSENAGDLNVALNDLVDGATYFGKAISANTDEDGNIDLLNLGDINKGLGEECYAEIAIDEATRSLLAGKPSTSTNSASITDLGESFYAIHVAKDRIVEAVDVIGGLPGVVFGVVVDVSGVTDALYKTSNGLINLADAIKSILGKLDSTSAGSLGGVIEGIRKLAATEANLGDAVQNLIKL